MIQLPRNVLMRNVEATSNSYARFVAKPVKIMRNVRLV